ncbi:ester cyclase [Paenibacillus sp. N3.4]|uniref:ester cyclase n=1 Tax=Paenibacillus sp. N3.4 TaxID=2603222 RepID=UPI0011CA8B1D|nr:ester cyclase [Paenibacillus sp. N3.4]TXK72422.1 ester cyclase [Paenibacillus sp. N3.4]
MMSTIDLNTNVVRSFIELFWNQGEFAGTEEFLTSGYVDHAYMPNHKEGLLNMANILHSAFPDQKWTIESMIAQDDKVVIRLTLRGTHTGTFRGTEPTNQIIEVNQYREFRLEDGKIAEHWALFDTATLFRQIGAEWNEQPACKINRP